MYMNWIQTGLLFLLGFFVLLSQRRLVESVLSQAWIAKKEGKPETFVSDAPARVSSGGTTYHMELVDGQNQPPNRMVLNRFPLLKPLPKIEKTTTGTVVNVARPEFIPYMQTRSSI